jgi:receptor protein-tyrosine kinase/non-specific protein-tyrosine kinase
MSRVFEALAKASKEKRQQVSSSSMAADISAPVGSGATLEPEPFIWQGPANAAPVDASTTTEKKSWRERIENVVYGWEFLRHSIVALEKESPQSEQYKILCEQTKGVRTQLSIGAFAVTSPIKRDGTTSVAVNLAAVSALGGEEEIILIDSDLRNPTVHKYLNVPLTPGLADCFASGSNGGLKRLVRDTFLPGLRILPAGKLSDPSAELLIHERLNKVIETLKVEFPAHQIIVVSPPVVSNADARLIARQVQGVLLVIRAGKTSREYLTNAIQALSSTQIMGVVVDGGNRGISSRCYSHSSDAGNYLQSDSGD